MCAFLCQLSHPDCLYKHTHVVFITSCHSYDSMLGSSKEELRFHEKAGFCFLMSMYRQVKARNPVFGTVKFIVLELTTRRNETKQPR